MNEDWELWRECACIASIVRNQKWTEKPEGEREALRRVSITCERVGWVHDKMERSLWLVGAERGSYFRLSSGTDVERLQRSASGEL